MRKVVQIQALRFAVCEGEDASPSQDTELIALCDDGTIWTKCGVLNQSDWVRVTDIPKTDE
jgi:hypothetical protein